jgi:hypothetical protein
MRLGTPLREALRVADEAWIALALLHREQPDRADFTEQEIFARIRAENLTGSLREGVKHHVTFHCVANKPPKPGNYRMLYATGVGTRRLFREGDDFHPDRKGKITPKPEDIPAKYHDLLDWYKTQYAPQKDEWLRGVFEMIGAGKEDFAGVNADDYVRQLREGWD